MFGLVVVELVDSILVAGPRLAGALGLVARARPLSPAGELVVDRHGAATRSPGSAVISAVGSVV
jgi:hypothetical protein